MKHPHSEFTHLLLALGLIWATGCGDRNASKITPKSGEAIASGKSTPLEESLTRWKAGDQAGAVQRFLEIDWKQNLPPFTPGSPLSLRERDIVKLSNAERERVMADVLGQLKDLKQLASAVRDQGATAAATDPAFSRRCSSKLNECAAALDQPEALKILQLTAQAIRKTSAAPAAAQPGR
jgi:hypothetical protein